MIEKKVLPGFEPGLLDSKSRMLTVTSQNRSGNSGIRTHEANAQDLKACPFDRSGILPLPHVGFEPTTPRLEV